LKWIPAFAGKTQEGRKDTRMQERHRNAEAKRRKVKILHSRKYEVLYDI